MTFGKEGNQNEPILFEGVDVNMRLSWQGITTTHQAGDGFIQKTTFRDKPPTRILMDEEHASRLRCLIGNLEEGFKDGRVSRYYPGIPFISDPTNIALHVGRRSVQIETNPNQVLPAEVTDLIRFFSNI